MHVCERQLQPFQTHDFSKILLSTPVDKMIWYRDGKDGEVRSGDGGWSENPQQTDRIHRER